MCRVLLEVDQSTQLDTLTCYKRIGQPYPPTFEPIQPVYISMLVSYKDDTSFHLPLCRPYTLDICGLNFCLIWSFRLRGSRSLSFIPHSSWHNELTGWKGGCNFRGWQKIVCYNNWFVQIMNNHWLCFVGLVQREAEACVVLWRILCKVVHLS